MPNLYICSKTYNEKSCYYIKFRQEEEIIEKDTGLILHKNDETTSRDVTYEFDTVTDLDIQKPDISQYTLNS